MPTLGKLSLDKFLLEGLTTGKDWASGTFTLPGTETSYTVSGLSFIPSFILIHYHTDGLNQGIKDSAFQWVTYDGNTSGWIQSVANRANPTLPASKPTAKSFVVGQAYASADTMYARWWAFE